MKTLLLFSLLVSAVNAFAGSHFPEDRTYVHDLFPSQQACEEARSRGFWGNCSQTLELRRNGTGLLMVTDIMNPVAYEIEGTRVVVSPKGPGELNGKLVFQLDEAAGTLTGAERDVWKRDR